MIKKRLSLKLSPKFIGSILAGLSISFWVISQEVFVQPVSTPAPIGNGSLIGDTPLSEPEAQKRQDIQLTSVIPITGGLMGTVSGEGTRQAFGIHQTVDQLTQQVSKDHGCPPGQDCGSCEVINVPQATALQWDDSDRTPASIPGTPPPDTVKPEDLGNLQRAHEIVDRARGLELLEAAISQRRAIEQAARLDQNLLSQAYRNQNLDTLQQSFQNSQKRLDQQIDALQSATRGLEGERERFANLYLNARDKAALLQATLQDIERKENLKSYQPFQQIFGTDFDPTKLPADTPSVVGLLAELFESSQNLKKKNTPDALVDRILFFNGLSPAEQQKVIVELRLAEKQTVVSKDGKSTEIPLLHNGYVFGSTKKGIDCSSFVSSVLPSDVRKGRLTTLDFYSMWEYIRKGSLPRPPSWPKSRVKLLKDMSRSFYAINIYDGQALAVGDLLVYRIPFLTSGHIFIVKKFDRKTQTVKVIEAAQSSGTIRERNFPLSLDPQNAKARYYRPGLIALRLKPTQNSACQYADNGRSSF